MQYKNIIFDLGNVLVKLNPEGCIGAFKAIGMGKLANPNPQSEGMKLMSKLGVGIGRYRKRHSQDYTTSQQK